MRMHERLGDTTRNEADKDIPNEVKHCFLLLTPEFAKITGSNIRTASQKRCKNSSQFSKFFLFLVVLMLLPSIAQTLTRGDDVSEHEQEQE
jgi:hypothetical protein